jgi:hypothetical protein
VMGFVPADAPAWLIEETSPFVAGRASGIIDVFAGSHLYGFLELRADRGEIPGSGDIELRIEQAFVRATPFKTNDASLQVGRFTAPFGNWPQRHHSEADPFIRPPLSYDYRTLVSTHLLPGGNDGFLDWKSDPDRFRPAGAPPVWAAPYQLGAMLLGTIGKASWRVAAMNGAPSTEPNVWNELPSLDDLNYVAHVAYQFSPALRLGVSYSNGSYLDADSLASLPSGQSRSDFAQRLAGVEAMFARGRVELRGEFVHDTWNVVRVAEPAVDVSWYLESKLKLAAGLFAAARIGAIHFNELPRANGTLTPWDYDVQRLQLGAGYRITEALDVRAELMLNRMDGPIDPGDDLLSVQGTWLIR